MEEKWKKAPKSAWRECECCKEVCPPSYFTRHTKRNGEYFLDRDNPYETCKKCRGAGKKAQGEFTTWIPSAIEADKPQYWPVGNFKIYQQVIKRIGA